MNPTQTFTIDLRGVEPDALDAVFGPVNRATAYDILANAGIEPHGLRLDLDGLRDFAGRALYCIKHGLPRLEWPRKAAV